ncbi:MAG: PucR family transcriptional regulator, partial [Pyramidobacter sp.]
SILKIEQKYRNDLIGKILSGENIDREEIERSSLFTGCSLGSNFRVVCLAPAEAKSQSGFNARLQIIARIGDIIAQLLPQALVHNSVDCLAILHPVPREESLQDYRRRFLEFFKTVTAGAGEALYAGVGRSVSGVQNIHKSYGEAQDALSYLKSDGSRRISDENFLFFSDLGIFKLLSYVEDRESLRQFVPESLERLYRSDKKHRDELIQTLESYLRNQLNLSATAKDLFIHYKTAMYRLKRIEEISGINFKNENEVLAVRIGMVVQRIIDHRPTSPSRR